MSTNDRPEPFSYQDQISDIIANGRGRFRVTKGDAPFLNGVVVAPGKAILYSDAGSGKTRIILDALRHLTKFEGKLLVICSRKAINTWRREILKWTPLTQEDFQIVHGSPVDRLIAWQNTRAKIYITTYMSGMIDLEYWVKFNFQGIIFDECRVFTNRKTRLYKFWSQIVKKVPIRLFMDGTLVKKGPQDLFTFFHMIEPDLFTSYWRFVNTFCIVVDGPFGKDIVGPQNTESLGRELRRKLIRVRDEDIKGLRPPLVRSLMYVDMTDQQRAIYDQLSDNLMAVTEQGKVIAASTVMSAIIKLRQLLVCPAILAPELGVGGAIKAVIDQMEDDPHVVIFTPFLAAISYIAKEIEDKLGLHKYNILTLQGGDTPDHIRSVEEHFNESGELRTAVVCSVNFAESFELWSAKRCFFIGYEWAQRINYQAEKRLHRMITPHLVNSYYCTHLGTIEEAILNVLNSNQSNVNITFQDYIRALSGQSVVGEVAQDPE